MAALNSHQIESDECVAATFNVSRARGRPADKPAHRDCQLDSKKLLETKEEVEVKYILDLHIRGLIPYLAAVGAMVNRRDGNFVGVK